MERYRRYTAALADRRTIVWGMGWREFERLVRNRWVLLVIGLAWAQTLLIALIVMPQGLFTPQEIHLRLDSWQNRSTVPVNRQSLPLRLSLSHSTVQEYIQHPAHG